MVSLKGLWPVRPGRKDCRKASSNGLKRVEMSATVRAKNIHLLAKPCIKAPYATCGCGSAVLDVRLLLPKLQLSLGRTFFESISSNGCLQVSFTFLCDQYTGTLKTA